MDDLHVGAGVEKYISSTDADLPVKHEFGNMLGAKAPA